MLLLLEGSDGVSRWSTNTRVLFTLSHHRRGVVPRLLMPLGNLQCSWVSGLTEDDWTGKWFMPIAILHTGNHWDFKDSHENENWILCNTIYHLSIYWDKIQWHLFLECKDVSTLQLPPQDLSSLVESAYLSAAGWSSPRASFSASWSWASAVRDGEYSSKWEMGQGRLVCFPLSQDSPEQRPHSHRAKVTNRQKRSLLFVVALCQAFLTSFALFFGGPQTWSHMTFGSQLSTGVRKRSGFRDENESESLSVVSDSLWLRGLYSPWNSPGQNTGVGSLSLLQGIFPTQGCNPGLPHCRQILYQLSHKVSPRILKWAAYPFSRGSFWPRNWIRVSCIAGGFFTNWLPGKPFKVTQSCLTLYDPMDYTVHGIL